MAFSRAELELIAAAVGIDPSGIPNDSVLEQRVLYNLKNAVAATGTDATGTITSTGTNPANNDTVTIGDQVYTFKTTLTGAANEVKIGAAATNTLDNLKAAINKTGTEGTDYGLGTPANPYVTAGTKTATTIQVTARDKRWGNSIATTETSAQLSWGSGTLTSGVPAVVAVPAAAKQAVSGGQYV